MPPPGPTSTAARGTPRSRCAATATADGPDRRGMRGPGACTSPSSRRTRSSMARAPTASAIAPRRRAAPDQRLRREQARGRAARSGACAHGRAGAMSRSSRTSWLHGPPGNDFPAKIAAAALRREGGRRAAAGRRATRSGRPTYTPDVADAIVELIGEDALFDERRACRSPPPRQRRTRVPGRLGPRGPARDRNRRRGRGGPGVTWQRASSPPLWAVLEPTPLPSGEPMRDWRLAFADAVPALRRGLKAAR